MRQIQSFYYLEKNQTQRSHYFSYDYTCLFVSGRLHCSSLLPWIIFNGCMDIAGIVSKGAASGALQATV